MAISLIAKPQALQPAYNPLKFIYSSTNVNEPGFRYIFDIYENGGSKIAEYRIKPNLSGYGEQDISRLLQNYVSYDFDSATNNGLNATNCYYLYDVNVGEEYIESIDYTSSLTQDGSYTKITATHSFQVGDQVVITQVSPGADNPTLEGLHTVTAINTTVDFTVNVLWSEITDATIDGNVAYADNRKTVTRDIITSTANVVFNGAIPFLDYIGYDDANYILDANTDLLLTSMPSGHYLTLDQDMWVNFYNNKVSTGYIYFSNSTGDVFRKTMALSGNITQMGVGCNNLPTLTLVSGSGSLIEDDVTYYEFWYSSSSGTQYSQKYRINIDRRCKINDYEIVFLDRMGSIGSFAFQLKDKLTGNVTKEVFNKHIEGYVSSQEWLYTSDERGMSVINPTIDETFDLNTDWITEEDARYFTELVSTPQAWIKINGVYVGCVVQDTGYEKERQKNRNLIRKSLKVKLSVQDRVNG